ncbi:YajQ family cyclic di-GMP-binding protein [Halodesulfovibrio sp. MK-HDV]|jgi:cyclic-di-GMP-binding protein|uniref:YajQ family cyclic di-GMP-binding protein n=1 Tax=unclassified Halodesulfovibrio TaxID=2644657 RepID=UPI00136D1265|nr:YajQ family cyclic di-GMP-binding protein [Halodesulfovibrio sp. MK-HDV]KAF1073871.1 hypothetical protein MKHDV_03210 [Halodesulfovibrio sp. MK-HDV]
MPSFDVVNKVDLQEVDNAVNNVRKEVETRYDFRGTTTELSLDKGNKRLSILAGDELKMKAVEEMLKTHFLRRNVDPQILEFKDPEPTSKGALKRDVVFKEGIEKDLAKKMVKEIKASKLKVQAQIQDDQLRVTGKKLDDLQAVMAMLREGDYGIPLQFVNMKN